jgi:hypothetical protein
MAKTKKGKSAAAVTDAAAEEADANPPQMVTVADVAVVANLAAAPRTKAYKPMSTTLITTFSGANEQKALTGVQSGLTAYAGCGDVPGALALANEGAALAATIPRLQSSIEAARQRMGQIRIALQTYQTALAAATPPEGSPVAKAIGAVLGARAVEITKVKATKTRTKNKKKPKPPKS